jgi:hypothetical protein
LAIQAIAGAGGVLLLIGIVLLGYAYLDKGNWGELSDPPARVTILGILILVGAALSHAVRRSRAE